MIEHEIMTYLREVNLVAISVRLLLALLCGGAIGVERGRRGRAAGFRTHIVVCLGAAMATLTGQYIVQYLGMTGDPGRLGAQVISGIGFLGVGTILVTGRSHVRGLTTAAGLWSTATVGLAIGIGFYEAALLCTLLLCVAIVMLHHMDNVLFKDKASMDVYIEIQEAAEPYRIIKEISAQGYQTRNIEIKPSRTGMNAVGLEATVAAPKKGKREDIIEEIAQIKGVVLVIESA